MSQARRTDRLTLAAFGLAVLLYAANFVAIRVVIHGVSPIWGAFLRFAPAAGILALIAVAVNMTWPRGSQLAAAVVYGVFAFGISPALIYWALLSINAGLGSLLFATVPLFTLLFAVSIRQETFRWSGIGGALLAITGIAIISGGSMGSATGYVPILAAIASAAFAAAAVVVLKRVPAGPPVTVNAVGMGVGSLSLLVVVAILGESLAVPTILTTNVALVFLILSTCGATVLLVFVLNRWTASGVAYQTVLSPPITVILAALFLDEPVTWRLAVGGALVLLGVWIGAIGVGTRANARPRP
jgi:drug/metabolite transporter (DMT)-like permease